MNYQYENFILILVCSSGDMVKVCKMLTGVMALSECTFNSQYKGVIDSGGLIAPGASPPRTHMMTSNYPGHSRHVPQEH